MSMAFLGLYFRLFLSTPGCLGQIDTLALAFRPSVYIGCILYPEDKNQIPRVWCESRYYLNSRLFQPPSLSLVNTTAALCGAERHLRSDH